MSGREALLLLLVMFRSRTLDLRSGLGENVADNLFGTPFLLGVLNSQTRLLASSKQVTTSIVVFIIHVIVIVVMIMLVRSTSKRSQCRNTLLLLL